MYEYYIRLPNYRSAGASGVQCRQAHIIISDIPLSWYSEKQITYYRAGYLLLQSDNADML